MWEGKGCSKMKGRVRGVGVSRMIVERIVLMKYYSPLSTTAVYINHIFVYIFIYISIHTYININHRLPFKLSPKGFLIPVLVSTHYIILHIS